MKVLVSITSDTDPQELDIEAPAVPRVGEEFILANDEGRELTYTVVAVWWTVEGKEAFAHCELELMDEE